MIKERNAMPSEGDFSPSYYPTVSGDLLSRTNLLKWIREWARAHDVGKFYTMEFGVLNGEGSIDMIRQLRGKDHIGHFGFDSFNGFGDIGDIDQNKENLMPVFKSGAYQGMSKEDVYKNISNMVRFGGHLELIEGFFNDSLPKFDLNKLDGFPLVMHVDCDLYQASKECFEFIEKFAKTGTWILCDDYWCYRGDPKAGQRFALDEWEQNNSKIGLTPYSNFRGFGRAFIAYEK